MSDADLYVVKSRRTYGETDVTSVLTSPAARSVAIAWLAEFNVRDQNPGNYYIEKWEARS